MRRRTWALLAIGASLVAALAGPAIAAAPRAPQLIQFTNDPTGSKPNGWMSVDSNITIFSDSIGADLQVNNFGNQSHGNALSINFDDQSFLKIRFTVPVCGLRLAFGNDDPLFSNPGDRALLRVSNGPVTVGKAAVVMNRNDLMDQSIGFQGASFTDAAFWYAVTTNGLAEIVDDIVVVPC